MDRICLIVDDEPCIRGYLKIILGRAHFQVLEAGSAPEALKMVRALNGALDIIVTDVVMPGDMNGVDLANAVRNAFPQIPIIVISGYLPQTPRRCCANFEWITKPFKAETILEAINRVSASPT